MHRPAERRWPGILAGYGILIGVLVGVATFFYVSVAEAHRELVIRLAATMLIGVAMWHVRTRLQIRIADRFSEFERMLRPKNLAVNVDPLFAKLRDELKYSAADRRYFKRVLWPRLVRLARDSGQVKELDEPAERWIPRVGPSLRTLAALVHRVEGEP
jgi:hypothetical protein